MMITYKKLVVIFIFRFIFPMARRNSLLSSFIVKTSMMIFIVKNSAKIRHKTNLGFPSSDLFSLMIILLMHNTEKKTIDMEYSILKMMVFTFRLLMMKWSAKYVAANSTMEM